MDLQAEALLSAVRKGNVDEVSRLIEQGIVVNNTLAYRNGYTTLGTSVIMPNEQITKMLLKAGADMNLKDYLGFMKIVAILLDTGGDFNATKRNGERAFEIAMKVHYDKVLNDFLSMSPNLNLETKKDKQLFLTAFEFAIHKFDPLTSIVKLFSAVPRSSLNNISENDLLSLMNSDIYLRRNQNLIKVIIQTFLRPNFNINVKGRDGNTILHELFLYSFLEEWSVLRCLLEIGADPNAKNRFGRTPSHYSRNLEINWIKLLADYKADFGVADKLGMTPLHYLVYYEKSPNIIRIFIDQGGSTVNVNQRSIDGKTALDLACRRGSINVVKLLLDYGADIDWLEAFKKYLESVAQIKNIAHCYRELMFIIEHIDVNAVDSDGKVWPESLIILRASRNGTWKFVIQHIALVEALEHPINQSVYNGIYKSFSFKEFFTKCQKELILAKETNVIKSSSVTYFQLLTSTKHQLKNYSGNYDLVMDIFSDKHEDDENLFPIYRNAIREKVSVGMELRLLFVKAAEVLSREIPIFDASSLILHDTLDCILNKEDLSKIVDGYEKN